jgi:hypothetical protein
MKTQSPSAVQTPGPGIWVARCVLTEMALLSAFTHTPLEALRPRIRLMLQAVERYSCTDMVGVLTGTVVVVVVDCGINVSSWIFFFADGALGKHRVSSYGCAGRGDARGCGGI